MEQKPKKKGLEQMLNKVQPAVDDLMQKFMGVRIKELGTDLSAKLTENPLLGMELFIYLPFKEAKKKFKQEYVRRIMVSKYGNISEVARVLNIDRRSIHRIINEGLIDADKIRSEMLKPDYLKKEAVGKMVESTIKNYEEYIHPQKLAEIYENVEEMSKDLLVELDFETLTLKDAENYFEKEFLKQAMEMNKKSISKTAKAIKLRYETLYRKLRDHELI